MQLIWFRRDLRLSDNKIVSKACQAGKVLPFVPVKNNYLLNPEHPDLKVSLESPFDFKFDQRMWKV